MPCFIVQLRQLPTRPRIEQLLVGRGFELEQVSAALAAGGRPLLYGEAGVGKTTLARAVVSAAGRQLVEAGALATLSWLPYLPFRRVLGRQPDGDPAQVAADVERAVGDAVLLLDDVHWADADTRAAASLLAGRLPVIATVRRGDAGAVAALEELGAAGFHLVPLEPLGAADAAELVGSLRPSLSRTERDALLARAGGNPLLLEELAATGEPTESLRLAVAARLRGLAAAGGEAMALLALAGRPLEPSLLPDGGAELVEAGVAVAADGTVAIRHALLGESAVALLDAERRRVFHERLGRALADPGEAARHFLQAGLRADAYERALAAAEGATTPGERAAHLGVAATCADGADADDLKLRAAAALLDAGRPREALSLLETLAATDPLVLAEARLLEYRGSSDLDRTERARSAFVEAAELVEGSSADVEIRVAIESADVAGSLDRDYPEALRRAEAAYAVARKRGVHLHRARLQLGTWRLWEGKPGWERLLRASIRESFARQDYVTARDAAGSLVYGLLVTGQPHSGRRFAARVAATAADLKLLGMERFMRSQLCGFLWHLGEWARAVDEAREVVGGVGEAAERRLAQFYLAQSLIDLGRYDDARRLVADRLADPEPSPPYWLLSDLELWSGRPHEADAIATEGLANLPAEGAAIFVRLTQCWARLELGSDLGPSRLLPYHAMAEAAPIEERGVVELAAGNPAAAVALFDDAALLWRGRHARGELRCLWAAGEAARLAGDEAGARERLLLAETRAKSGGAVAVLVRIQRSLRLAGIRRAAQRGRSGSGLTAREREILDLVGAGLSNAEIGRRLGIGRPTVARLVATASTKLGAGSRLQAAALATRADA